MGHETSCPGVNLGFDYARTNNPTRQRLEDVLAELEGVTYGAVFASGLAAEHAVLHAHLRAGDDVVVPNDVYGGTHRLLTRVFAGLNPVLGLSDTLIRLSPGLEHPDDLVDDLLEGLDVSAATRTLEPAGIHS